MNTFSHIAIGSVVRDVIARELGVPLPLSFVWANCKPDFTLDMIRYPHHIAEGKTLSHIQDEIRILCRPGILEEMSWRAFSIRLGMVCHYLCDFFCFVHNDRFEGSFKEHFLYEWRLNAYCRGQRYSLRGMDYRRGASVSDSAPQLLKRISLFHERYLERQPGWDVDLICSVQICTELVRTVLQQALDTRKLFKTRRGRRRMAAVFP